LSFLVLFIFILIGIASTPSKKSMTAENGQVPPDFKGYKGTLVIISSVNSWNKYAKKAFQENYHGKYIFVRMNEISTKCADMEEYRYVMGNNITTTSEIGGNFSYTSSESLCIVDRQINKKYCTGSSAFYAKQLKVYAEALEEARN
jgi:hypothetical protein